MVGSHSPALNFPRTESKTLSVSHMVCTWKALPVKRWRRYFVPAPNFIGGTEKQGQCKIGMFLKSEWIMKTKTKAKLK